MFTTNTAPADEYTTSMPAYFDGADNIPHTQTLETGGWQACPICNGKGRIPADGYTTNACDEQCDVCKGRKIISIVNGLPPDYSAALTLTHN